MTTSLFELDTEYCQWYPAIEVQSSYPHCQPCGLHNPESENVINYFKIIVDHFMIENLHIQFICTLTKSYGHILLCKTVSHINHMHDNA